MTTPTPNSGPWTGDTAAIAKAKAAAEAKKKEKKKKKRKNKKNNNNNNHTIHPGLMKDGILKGITISTGSSAQITTDYRLYSKVIIAFVPSKGFDSLHSGIKNMTAIEDKAWKTERPNKSLYASKCTTKVKSEGGTDILK